MILIDQKRNSNLTGTGLIRYRQKQGILNVFNGAKGFAGELSHIQLVENGDLCICGKRGCFETVTSAYVLLSEAAKGIKENTISQLTGKFSVYSRSQ